MNLRTRASVVWTSVVFITGLTIFFSSRAESSPAVRTPLIATSSGPIAGIEAPDRGIEAFLGIPYADPPKRFERARMVTPWTSVLQAVSYGPACIQFTENTVSAFDLRDSSMRTSEDCLTLNVWRPVGGVNLPVLFFIHGGRGKGTGSAMAYSDFPQLAQNAVVVTIQYRLSALGNLAHPALSALNTDLASGNQGLWDIRLALEWVHANAVTLGGNSERITVHGESAGGLATLLTYVSPVTRGLFSSAIVQSSPYFPDKWLPLRAAPGVRSGEAEGAAFADYLKCDPAAVLACLQTLPIQNIVNAVKEVVTGENNPSGSINLWYYIDGVALAKQPEESLRTGDFNRLPLVVGSMIWEPGPFLAATWIGARTAIRSNGDTLGMSSAINQQIVDYYTNQGRFASPSQALTTFHHDISYYCYIRHVLNIVSNVYGVPAAGYEIDYAPWFFNAGTPTHGGELQLLFSSQNFSPYFTATDRKVSKDLENRWVSFSDPAQRPFVWEAFGAQKMMNELGASPSVSGNMRSEACELIEYSGIYSR